MKWKTITRVQTVELLTNSPVGVFDTLKTEKESTMFFFLRETKSKSQTFLRGRRAKKPHNKNKQNLALDTLRRRKQCDLLVNLSTNEAYCYVIKLRKFYNCEKYITSVTCTRDATLTSDQILSTLLFYSPDIHYRTRIIIEIINVQDLRE